MAQEDETLPPLPAGATAKVERIPQGIQVTLRPFDAPRWVSGPLLGLLLVSWAPMEFFALGWGFWRLMVAPVGSELPRFDGFVLGWLVLWTIFGVIPLYALLRALRGIDRVTIGPKCLTLWHGIGRWGWGHRLDLRDTRGVRLHRGTTALVAEVNGKRRTLTSFGTESDRRWLRDLICEVAREIPSASIPAPVPVRLQHSASPTGYRVQKLPDGSTRLTASAGRRAGVAGCALVLTLLWNGVVSVFLLIGLHLLPPNEEAPSKGPLSPGGWGFWLFLTPFILIGLGLMVALFLAIFESEEWRVGANSLETRKVCLGRRQVSRYSNARFQLSVRIDSEGDESWRLRLITPAESRDLDSGDPTTLRTLGLFLSSLTGWPLCELEED
jgi:hypothetical protein